MDYLTFALFINKWNAPIGKHCSGFELHNHHQRSAITYIVNNAPLRQTSSINNSRIVNFRFLERCVLAEMPIVLEIVSRWNNWPSRVEMCNKLVWWAYYTERCSKERKCVYLALAKARLNWEQWIINCDLNF